MIDYISEEDICRSSYLLEYFGQTESNDCGTCDVCRSARRMPVKEKATLSEDIAAEIVRYVNDEMSGHYGLDDVARRFGSPVSASTHTWTEILRRLIDQGTVPPPEQ